MKVMPDGTYNPEVLEEGFEIPEGLRAPEMPKPRESPEETTEKAKEAGEFLDNLDDKQAEELAAPERESKPQLEWPESDANGQISEHDYVHRLDYRLTEAGFALDAARAHLESEIDTAEWLKLKQRILGAKANQDMYTKVDLVIKLEEDVRDFALKHGTTEAEAEAARTN